MSEERAEFKANPDPRWVAETLVEDFVETQHENGVAVPSVRENEDVVLETLRDLDAREANAKPKPEKPAETKRHFEDHIEDDDGVRSLSQDEISRMLHEQERAIKAMEVIAKVRKARELLHERWRLLMTKPEWRKRLQDAFILGHLTPQSRGGGQKAMSKVVDAILEASNSVFGDWKKEPGKKLIFS